jgi:hypothetical protein
VCIWELCMIVFVGRPALVTEVLVPWWHLHLCDRRLMQQELPQLEKLEHPETHSSYWVAIRKLIVRGLPDAALRLLNQHSVLRSAVGGDDGGDEQLLFRLSTLLEFMPRLADPELMQVGHTCPAFCRTAVSPPSNSHVSFSSSCTHLSSVSHCARRN